VTAQSVLIARYIEQVEDGTHYKGHLNITGVEFEYEVILKKPIKQFIASKSINSLEELRNIFTIAVKQKGVEIPLSEDEYKFFAMVLIEFAKQTKASLEKWQGVTALLLVWPESQLGFITALPTISVSKCANYLVIRNLAAYFSS
jgi:hypothetical protein